MNDQVSYLESQTGTNAVVIHADTENISKVLADVKSGIYLVYASPESMLSRSRLRRMLSSSSLRGHCIGVAIDETHVIAEWQVYLFVVKSKCMSQSSIYRRY